MFSEMENQINQNDTTLLEVVELHEYEVRLLRLLRNKYRFGEVSIIMRDGLPMRLKRITEFDDLNV